jgi:hypothetical protein
MTGRSEVVQTGWEKRSRIELLGEVKSYRMAGRSEVVQTGWEK